MTGFPIYRPRRLRATENLRSLIRETSLSVKDLIFPLFVVPGENVKNEIETLKNNPGNRRMVLSLWQNEWLETAALPSCVWNSQWNLIDGKLNILVTSRSSDVPLGLPFNVVQYAVLCHLIAHVVGAKPGQFTFITNDAHIYENQIDGIKEQIARYDEAKKNGTLPKAPTLWLNPEIKDFYDFDNSRALKDIKLENYENLGTIKMPVTE